SGIPQVIMPFNVDQPFWAKRLFDLGYSLKPLKESDSVDEFASRFVEMDKKEAMIRSEKIADVIKQENANSNAVRHIEKLYKEWIKTNE
ncbi:MAG: glycosyltransferase, partial [Lachnospiraceae bacterium]|nr:glycosyltransferase [Lachnospiraceae bacterium]